MPLGPVLKMMKNAYFCLIKCSNWEKIGFRMQVFGCPGHHHKYLSQINQLWKFHNIPITSKEAANLSKIEKIVRFRSSFGKAPVLPALGNK